MNISASMNLQEEKTVDTKNQAPILLIDGSNLAFRMFFALERTNLRNKEGHPTWAIYGTLKALFDVMELVKPAAIAAAFDLPQPSFRHEMFDDYKANRPDEMPDELQEQWAWIKESFRKFNIPVMEEAGFEADDLIGIVARAAENEGQNIVILSGDRDLFQLVSDKVKLAAPQKGGGIKIYSPADVYEQMGVRPDQIVDYKAIAGDSSDNIPGVKGLGDKSAIKLLETYGNLDNIYQNLTEVSPPKTKEKLETQEDSARLSQYLATIIVDETKKGQASDYLNKSKLNLPDTDSLIEFLKVFEFNSILKRLPILLKSFNNGEIVKVQVDLPEEAEAANTKKFEQVDMEIHDLKINPILVQSEEDLDKLVAQLEKAEQYAIDLETTGLNTLNCEIVGWAFALHSHNAEDNEIYSYYIPVRHSLLVDSNNQLNPDLVRAKLQPILENENKLQIIQNIKFEHKLFKRLGLKIHKNFYDIMLASYIENPSNKHGLKQQSKRILHLRMQEIDELIGTGKKQISIDQVPIQDVAAYAASDAYITYRLFLYYKKSLSEKQNKLLTEVDFPFASVLTEIELSGVSIDTKYLSELSVELHSQLKLIKDDIYKITGKEFNISSPKQLSEVLYTDLAIATTAKRNKSGSFPTDQGTLEKILADKDLAEVHFKLINKILEFRTLSKLLSTYVDNLPQLLAKETNRIHSDFNQVLTSTGRLSSSNPNLQNIPIKTELGRKVRAAFIAEDDTKEIISADYSQIELRVLAHLAKEKVLINAFRENKDIHRETAMKIMSKSFEEVTDDDRRIGKTLNFALVYMQGTYSTAEQLKISNKEAKSFIDKYFEIFSSIKPFMEETLGFARENEYVETMFGRRRYFQNINSRNKMLQKEEERQAFNTVIQSAAADIMKKAMIDIQNKLSEKYSQEQAKIILQVHDEIVLEVSKEISSEVSDLVIKSMENIVELDLPLLANIGKGDNWLAAH